ncbi:MAG: YciI family protein [Shewanella sp.]|uniref:YciI family protein n=1 Tax=Shewanella sp. TaxID=50422 RepID=UPI003F3AFED0
MQTHSSLLAPFLGRAPLAKAIIVSVIISVCVSFSAMSDPLFDPQRAKKAGADEYGMKPYVMAFLKRGPQQNRTPEEAKQLQRAHLDNISRLANEGKLVLAGPFLHKGELRGIYVFDVKTVEEARALTQTDPAIQAGSLVLELLPWYGSAALTEINELHKIMAKKAI